MDEEQKKQYLEKYAQAKQKGVKFFPDIIYKDLLVSLAIFILLILLATFVGVASEPKADPSDTSYIPRPEWYFLFLFEMLKFVPGKLEWVGATVVPGIAVLVLFLLPLAVDGLTQAMGLRESTPALRVLTGLTTSAGTVWFVYPYIEAAMLDLRRELERKLKLQRPLMGT
jgi:quinol-cytochrome oxidoreductase complex cytochrome b subunit